MEKSRFLLYLIDNGVFKEFNEIIPFMTISGSETSLLKIKDDGYYGVMENKEIYLSPRGRAPYKVTDTIFLPKDSVKIVKRDVVTTFGKVFLNYFLLELILSEVSDVEYDEDISLSKFEDEYLPKGIEDGYVKVEHILKYGKVADYLHKFTEFTVPSGSEKLITPPDGIDEYKKKLFKEMEEKYGKYWTKNIGYVALAVKKLIEYDAEYLKDDDTYGVLGKGKITNIVRVSQYLMIGASISTFTEGEITTILQSLNDEPTTDPKILAAKFNNARSGSYERGIATADAGVRAKNISSSLSSYEVTDIEDCKGNVVLKLPGKFISYFKNRYDRSNKLLKGDEKLTTIELRSPMTCKLKGTKVCKKCAGTIASLNSHFITLSGIGLGGDGLNAKMKAMHGKELQSITIGVDDLFKP